MIDKSSLKQTLLKVQMLIRKIIQNSRSSNLPVSLADHSTNNFIWTTSY